MSLEKKVSLFLLLLFDKIYHNVGRTKNTDGHQNYPDTFQIKKLVYVKYNENNFFLDLDSPLFDDSNNPRIIEIQSLVAKKSH